jgi:hypothetical protein
VTFTQVNIKKPPANFKDPNFKDQGPVFGNMYTKVSDTKGKSEC